MNSPEQSQLGRASAYVDQYDPTLLFPIPRLGKRQEIGIAGAPPMRQPAQPVAQLQFNEIKELQNLLVRAGFNVGKVDGVLGQQSRVAVKAMQQKYGLPADSWPTAELLARMRGPGAQAQPAGGVMPR